MINKKDIIFFISEDLSLDLNQFLDSSLDRLVSSFELLFLIQKIEDKYEVSLDLSSIYEIKTMSDFVELVCISINKNEC